MAEAQIESDVGALSRALVHGAPVALHVQLSTRMREFIRSERWPVHMKLPPEPELARMLDVARGTVRRAIRTLLEEGLLTQTAGKGTFVQSPFIEQSLAQELVSSSQLLDREHIAYHTQVVHYEVLRSTPKAHAQLGMDEGEPVIRIKRTRATADAVVYVFDSYIPVDLCAGFELKELAEKSLYSLMEEKYGVVIQRARRTFAAVLPPVDIADLLHIAPADPVIHLEFISYNEAGRAIEFSDSWMRGDRVRISSWLERP